MKPIDPWFPTQNKNNNLATNSLNKIDKLSCFANQVKKSMINLQTTRHSYNQIMINILKPLYDQIIINILRNYPENALVKNIYPKHKIRISPNFLYAKKQWNLF